METDTALVLAEAPPFGQWLTNTGLLLPENLSYEDYVGIGRYLGEARRVTEVQLQILEWAIGDWLDFGEWKYGDKFAQAADVTGLSPSRLANIQWLARTFPPERRRPDLTLAHHESVAALPVDEADRLLNEAADNDQTAGELRRQVQDQRAVLSGEDPLLTRAVTAVTEAARLVSALEVERWAAVVWVLFDTLRTSVWDGAYKKFLLALIPALSGADAPGEETDGR